MVRLRRLRNASLLIAVACGGTQHTAPHDVGSACWPVAPMRLLTPDLGTGTGPLAPLTEVTADGALYNLDASTHERLPMFARVHDDALYDAKGQRVLSCTHRVLVLSDGKEMSRYEGEDVYVVDHTRLWITGDGTLMRQDWDRPAHAQGCIEGVSPSLRRTAMLLVLVGLGGFPR
jgi:hypothetical protein